MTPILYAFTKSICHSGKARPRTALNIGSNSDAFSKTEPAFPILFHNVDQPWTYSTHLNLETRNSGFPQTCFKKKDRWFTSNSVSLLQYVVYLQNFNYLRLRSQRGIWERGYAFIRSFSLWNMMEHLSLYNCFPISTSPGLCCQPLESRLTLDTKLLYLESKIDPVLQSGDIC